VERKVIVTRKSPPVLVIALILALIPTNVSWGHPTSAPEMPYVPVMTCQTVQLQSEDRKPVARAPVHLKVVRTKITGQNSIGIEAVTTFELLKKLKTDAAGKIQFPGLDPGSYILALPKTKKFTRPFSFRVDSKPGDCTQVFVLYKDYMVAIEPSAPKTMDQK
jgi:hypothetical protein